MFYLHVYITGHCMPEVTTGGKQVHCQSTFICTWLANYCIECLVSFTLD